MKIKIKIDHIAIWVNDLEIMIDFYIKYFNGKAGEIYHNPTKQFTSCFISFEEGCRLELMHRTDITENFPVEKQFIGITHIAISVGIKGKVNELTEQLRSDGFSIKSEPRTSGDGYYESVILDPEGNIIELTA